MGCIQPNNTKPSKPNRGEPEEKKASDDPKQSTTPEAKQSDNLMERRPSIARRESARFTGLNDYPAIRQRYKMLDIIGHGKYGVVYRAESKIDPGMFMAIKVLKCASDIDKKAITEEVKILKTLDHPNIIKYYEQVEDGPYVFVVTEYCSGGELLERISRKAEFNESEAAEILSRLLKALNHCHSKNIAHRDIKPENILYSTRDEHSEVKLIDFGLAKKSDRNLKTYQTIVGTPFYIAPEVIEGNYTYACDIWSLGIVFHIMLSGYMPYSGKTAEDVFRSIQKGKISFESPVWEKVSPPARDLLLKLLEPDENKRPTAAQALEHPWFKLVKTYTPEIDVLDTGIMASMKKYQGATNFQKACMNIFVKTLKDKEINNLVQAFNMLDKEKNGYIMYQDVLKVFHEHHPEVDINGLLKELALEGHAVINYSQFIAATLDAKHFLTTERLWALFQRFDVNNYGYLTAADIQLALNHSGDHTYSLEDVVTMLKAHNISEIEHINFEQFALIFKMMELDPEEETLQNVY